MRPEPLTKEPHEISWNTNHVKEGEKKNVVFKQKKSGAASVRIENQALHGTF